MKIIVLFKLQIINEYQFRAMETDVLNFIN